MKTELHIVKIGGRLLDDPGLRADCLNGFAALNGSRILIHGGGSQASDLARRLGLEVRMIDGRRITDDATLQIALMVYAGELNTRLVADLQALGTASIGLTGADGDLIRARRRSPLPVDFGWVGDVERVNTPLLDQLLGLGLCPVVCALSHDGQGQLLNTNADTIASELALSLAPAYDVKLWYSFDKDGVMADMMDPTSLISILSRSDFGHLREEGAISAGMLPKLQTGFRALEGGVRSVGIGLAGYFGRPNASFTKLTA